MCTCLCEEGGERCVCTDGVERYVATGGQISVNFFIVLLAVGQIKTLNFQSQFMVD